MTEHQGADEVAEKLALLRAWSDDRGYRAVVLTRPGSVAWLTAGLTSTIDRSDPSSPVWVVVTAAGAAAITTSVERPRLEAEAGLAELGLILQDVPWFDGAAFVRCAEEVAGLAAADLAADGHPGFGFDAGDGLAALRLRLLPPEHERLAALAVDSARALESALAAWQPGERDLDVQAAVAERVERSGAVPVCVIVGGDERVERFRHPLAAGLPVSRLVMAVLVATRGGLHAAATRFGCAGALPESVELAQRAAREIEARMLAASRPGATYGDVLRACDDAYAAVGSPGGWQEHYQGGPIGYRQREFEIAPSQRESRWFSHPVEAGQAVAWNPSVAGGGKSEDTFLIEDEGVRCLTSTGTWPLVEGRHAVLDVATGAAAETLVEELV